MRLLVNLLFAISFLFGCKERTNKSGARFERIVAADTTYHLSPVLINNCWGYADSTQHIKIPPRFDAVFRFTNSLAAVCNNQAWGFIDTSGKIVIPLIYDRALPFFENKAVV